MVTPADTDELTLMPRLKARKTTQVLRPNVESFYHLPNGVAGKCCQGTACFVARHLNHDSWERARKQPERVYCLGKCYIGPSCDSDTARPHIQSDSRVSIVLERIRDRPVRELDEYLNRGGFGALLQAYQKPRHEILWEVERSELRGRGGAAFTAGKKCRLVAQQNALIKFVVVNADEGDPGAYLDRMIIENDPYALIEGMAIAAYIVGSQKGFIYLRAEYPQARIVLETALDEVRRRGLLQNPSDGSIFDIELVIGKGSYLCGEESALLNAMAHKRPVAMARPPYAAEHGLFGKPTLINNVETLAVIPWIVRNGGEAYRSLGFSKSRGTKLVSLNSLFHRPGLYEVEFGVSVRHIVETLGGGLKTGELKGVMIGGPLAGVIPPALLDTPFGFEELHAIGASVGHGGVVAFDEHTTIPELIHYIFSFGAYESCGKCTPCRLGTREIEALFGRVLENTKLRQNEAMWFHETVAALRQTSLCGHGLGLADFALSIAQHYREELEACFASR